MNFKANESDKKLKGSYYTPDWIANYVTRWVKQYGCKTILEPSCGDGVFLDAIQREMSGKTPTLTGFDTDLAAIEACYKKESLRKADLSLSNEDFLSWAINNIKSGDSLRFDAVVGNPPFVRYQYLEKELQSNAQEIFDLLGMKFTKHTNLWIPFVIASIEFLRPGGLIGMVVPSEILHVLYAQGLRDYLLHTCSKILLIDPEDLWFDGTLQGAMLLMAQKKEATEEKSSVAIIRTQGAAFAAEDPNRLFMSAEYVPSEILSKKWTYALLSQEEREAYARVRSSASVFPFEKLADVDVGIVTGANKYFLVSDEVVGRYSLGERAHPMFGRSEHCPGVIYDEAQHKANKANGFPTNFLYFDKANDDITFADYIKTGLAQNINDRYKCRVRKPWYKVPSVFSTPVNMLKRSNGMPRLILNRMNAYTTDTAYRITPKPNIDVASLVYCFLNTITALSAELEGRFYGGGVLELVPSEIERLVVPYIEGAGKDIDYLDKNVRKHSAAEILNMQDEAIFSKVQDITFDDILILRRALVRLQLRRQRITAED